MAAAKLHLSGEYVVPGTYRNMGTGEERQMMVPGFLPRDADGYIACYVRLQQQTRYDTQGEPKRPRERGE